MTILLPRRSGSQSWNRKNRELVEWLEQIRGSCFQLVWHSRSGEGRRAAACSAVAALRRGRVLRASAGHGAGSEVQGAARKLLIAAAQHAPVRFTQGQLLTFARLQPSGGHFNAGRKHLRQSGYVEENNNLVGVTKAGLKAAGTVPLAPSTPAQRLALWCERLPAPAPRSGAGSQHSSGCSMSADELAAGLFQAEWRALEFRYRNSCE